MWHPQRKRVLRIQQHILQPLNCLSVIPYIAVLRIGIYSGTCQCHSSNQKIAQKGRPFMDKPERQLYMPMFEECVNCDRPQTLTVRRLWSVTFVWECTVLTSLLDGCLRVQGTSRMCSVPVWSPTANKCCLTAHMYKRPEIQSPLNAVHHCVYTCTHIHIIWHTHMKRQWVWSLWGMQMRCSDCETAHGTCNRIKHTHHSM